MENSNDNLIVNSYFPILYPDQKFKNTIEYKRWKKSITEIVGENGIEMLCNRDKIVIYENINENLKCPICKEKYFYCPYCKRAEKKKSCCIRGFIKDILNGEIDIYINIQDEDKRKEFIHTLLMMFIPFVFNFVLFFIIFVIFYFSLIKNDVYVDGKISNGKLNLFLQLIIRGFLLLMSLVYMIIFYSLFLFIFILSIPFKLYPIKYYLGILDAIDF